MALAMPSGPIPVVWLARGSVLAHQVTGVSMVGCAKLPRPLYTPRPPYQNFLLLVGNNHKSIVMIMAGSLHPHCLPGA
jgi:hypothetical protein